VLVMDLMLMVAVLLVFVVDEEQFVHDDNH
jgi:hypothetical protein